MSVTLWWVLFLSTSALIVSGLNRVDFSSSLQQAVNDMIGSDKFKKHLEQIAPQFRREMLDGRTFTKMFADDINRKVKERANIVRELKKTITEAFNGEITPSKKILKCCPEEPLNLRNDPRFGFPTNDRIICHYGKNESKKESERVTGMSDRLLDIMKLHHKRVLSLKWQYYGNEHGTLYTYPSVGTCGDSLRHYDPRVRPWYSFAVSIPKDLVIMVDKSQSMAEQFGSTTRIHYAIKAALAIILSANPNDHIGVISFDDEVHMSTAHPCYSRDLALMTPANKNKLTEFVGNVNPQSGTKANFSNALREAYRLLSNEEQLGNKKREKGILLLSAGMPSDTGTLAEINRTIVDEKRQAGRVLILAFGIGSDSSGAKLLETISKGGMFKNLDDSSEENIRKHVGKYNNHFSRPADDQNTIFTQPYIGSQGLGLIMSQCLSVIAQGEVKGVTCADIKVDTFFSEIVDFRLGQLSYSFFVDSRSRILIHPLLPRPDIYYKEPRFLDIESVELSSETSEIKQAMLSDSSGNMSTSDLKISLRRGDSPLEGVTAAIRSATYFWSPIQLMNASVAIVVVGNETNTNLFWTSNFPPVLLTDELTVSGDQRDKCNNFGRVTVKGKSAVKLSLQSFKDSFYYTNDNVNRIPELKSYLQGQRSQQGALAVKTGVREAIAMTYELENIWKSQTAGSSSALGNPIYRYVGTREGVYRIYPGITLAKSFDPTQQPQYRRAEALGDEISVFTEAISDSLVTASFTKAFFNQKNADNVDSVLLGVIGADVLFSSLYNFLVTKFDPCTNSSLAECFAIDRSGLIIIHKDFVREPPKSQMHITQKEPQIADDMLKLDGLKADTCVSYEDITSQLFWKANFADNYVSLSSSDVYKIDGVDMFVIVKKSDSLPGNCACAPITGENKKPKCTEKAQCQCPCFSAAGYNYCSGHFTVTNSTKACYPGTLSLDVIDRTTNMEQSYAKSLSSCLDCSLFNTESDCTATGCCWSSDACKPCSKPDNGDYTGTCERICLILVISISAGVLIILLIVIAVIFTYRRRRRRSQTPIVDPAIHKTVVTVGDTSLSSMNGYEEIPPYSSTPTTSVMEDPDYLHFPTDPDYLHIPGQDKYLSSPAL